MFITNDTESSQFMRHSLGLLVDLLLYIHLRHLFLTVLPLSKSSCLQGGTV